MARASLAARPAAARSAVSAELTPRERLLRLGAAALSDAELVSVLLEDTSSETAALDQAIDLLREIGGFPGFLRIDADSLRGLGLSRRKAAVLVSALELSHRLTRDELPRRPLLDDPEAVVRYAAARYRSPDQQILGALFLDPCCRLITDCEIFRGGLTGAAVEPGAVFRRALKASAAWVVVFQTRCGGEPAPTAHDWAFTRRLVDAGKTLGVGLCDHLIVASAERWVSLHRRDPW
jgi:DNA repair protein RadC